MIEATIRGWVISRPSSEQEETRIKLRATTRHGPALITARATDPLVRDVLHGAEKGDRLMLAGEVAPRLYRDESKVTRPALEVWAAEARRI